MEREKGGICRSGFLGLNGEEGGAERGGDGMNEEEG